MTDENLILEIEYVDYIIARNIISTVDSWEAGLEKNDYYKVVDIIQRYSNYFPNIIRILFFIMVCGYLISTLTTRSLHNFFELSKFGLISVMFIYAVWLLFWKIFRK
jgi:hypothetical protein